MSFATCVMQKCEQGLPVAAHFCHDVSLGVLSFTLIFQACGATAMSAGRCCHDNSPRINGEKTLLVLQCAPFPHIDVCEFV